MKKTILIAALAMMALMGCQEKKNFESSAASAAPKDTALTAPVGSSAASASLDGQALFGSKCAACHQLNDPSPVGPSLKEIQGLDSYKGKPEAIVAWAKSPAKTPKRAGKSVMPPVSASDAELSAIAAYILAAK